MSKIGRKPISTKDVQVEIKGNEIHYKGSKASGVHELPAGITAKIEDDNLILWCDNLTIKNKEQWGLHRALLANKFTGARTGFEQDLVITGLGYKGALTGNKIVFSLGFSHKIDYNLPEGIAVDIDKSGQKIKVTGIDKEKVGFVASQIRALRPPEPYKGTGIKLANEEIRRKVGKKSA